MNQPLHITTKDHFLSKETYDLYKHQEGILRTSPVPKDLEKYYQSANYISHNSQGHAFRKRLYRGIRNIMTTYKLRILKNQNKKFNRLLDIGAGTGAFIERAHQLGWKVHGVEPNIKYEKPLKKDINISVDYPKETFQVITMWHVLEHIINPKKEIQKLKTLLEDDGILVLALPNYQSFDAKYYKSHWAGYDVPRHLWHFSSKGIKNLMKEQGFRCVKTKPMWFDAFYVSMLSEGYLGRHFTALRGFSVGLFSNILAMIGKKEYSSNIFVFRKL